MKRVLLGWSIRAAALLVLLAVAGLLLAALGIVPIKASSGHWAITASLLQFAKTRSVATHTLGGPKLSFDEPWLVLKGAGHYEGGCRPCHGTPGFQTPVIAAAMTPRPPYLGPRIGRWDDDELFYIVKHGIKFTGMPAWPALQRDDEVRAVVAFLLELPKLDGDAYRRLVHGAPEPREGEPELDALTTSAAPASLAGCARCHGARGEGRGNAAFPRLAAQPAEYLLNALDAYASGRRYSGIMQPIAAALTASEKRELADFYAQLPGLEPDAQAPEELRRRGEQIVQRGIRGQGVPSCKDCHGPGPNPRNPAYPRLAGQFADYLKLQLELFKHQKRGGSPYAHIMHNVASRLEPEQMQELAAYYASLPSAAP